MSGSINLGEMFRQYQEHDQLSALAAGTYQLEITSAKAVSNGVRPVFKVVGGPNAGQKVMAGGFYLTEKSRSIFFRNMTCVGLGPDYFASMPTLDDVAKALTGRVIEAELTVKEYNGENRNEIPIGRMKLVSAPALPGVNGAPNVNVAQAAPLPPAPAAPATPAPAAVAPPVAAPAAATTPPPPAPPAVAPIAVADPGF